jgi:phosphoribosylanthranilate isomerase
LTHIKICGITNVEDACYAAEAGADMLGFVFYRKSPRYVTAKESAFIAGVVRGAFGKHAPRFVGVFVDETVDCVHAILEAARLDMAQLHGSESPAVVRELYPRAFKAVRPRTWDEAQAAVAAYRDTVPDDDSFPELLVDAYHPQHPGGTGIPADQDVAQWLARRVRLLLAGGLAPETVVSALERVQPWGVDVSSGVERARGAKDHTRVRAFIEAVRALETSPRKVMSSESSHA